MVDDEVVEEFIEHFGKRGMHWGIRNPKAKTGAKGVFRSRSGKQKLALVGAGVGGAVVTHFISSLILGNRMPISRLALSGGGAYAGVRLTRNYLDNKGHTPVSSLPKLNKSKLVKK